MKIVPPEFAISIGSQVIGAAIRLLQFQTAVEPYGLPGHMVRRGRREVERQQSDVPRPHPPAASAEGGYASVSTFGQTPEAPVHQFR